MIKLNNITKLYNTSNGKITGLDDVSLEIGKGSYTVVLGHSGSGKSTLMNILGGLDFQDRGTYYLDGIDISSLPTDAMSRIRNRKIGYVFQSFNLIPYMTALENIELPLVYRGVSRNERRSTAEKALECVELSHRSHHKATQLSGGQQQRVAIARAIASDPPILLADEPCGNLDRNSAQTVMRIFSDLHDRGKTIVLITHDENAAVYADSVIRIEDGRVLR